MTGQPSVSQAAADLRATTLRSVQRLVHDLDGSLTKLRQAVQSEVRNNPLRSILVAAGAGYVLGGGLAAPVTRRLVRLGIRAMVLPALDEPVARLWDWIRSEPDSAEPTTQARRAESSANPGESTRQPAVAKGAKHHGT